MITDFPDAKKAIKKLIDSVLKEEVRKRAPMSHLVNRHTLHEGDKIGVVYSDGRHEVNELQYVQSEFSVATKDIPTMKPGDFLDKVSAAAEDMAGQMERGLFEKMNDVAQESGNTIPGNPELSPESILVALERLSIDFEDDDRLKAVKPSIVTAPAAYERLKVLDAKLTPEEREDLKRREEAIMDRKYEEHLRDLESRKIID